MSNIFITGVEGFIGTALAKVLVKDHNVVGLAFDSHQCGEQIAHHMIYGDVRDCNLMKRIIGDYEINSVFHLASQSIVRICANDPVTAYDINIMGLVSVLEACRISGANTVKSVVVSTSDKMYGHISPPYTEETTFQPKFTYETSKACQDLITQSYYHNYKVPTKVVRCSNVYGPGDKNLSRLIPRSITLINEDKAPVLYGGVEQYIREFIYIDDVVNAFRIIDTKSKAGEVYCVGGSGHYKILDVINLIIELMHSHIKPILESKSDNFKEIKEQYINSTKLQSLGWKPTVNLTQGLVECIKYYTGEQP